jgi:hypothetical protein
VLNHAPLNAAANGTFFVEREIVAGAPVYALQNLLQVAGGFC